MARIQDHKEQRKTYIKALKYLRKHKMNLHIRSLQYELLSIRRNLQKAKNFSHESKGSHYEYQTGESSQVSRSSFRHDPHPHGQGGHDSPQGQLFSLR